MSAAGLGGLARRRPDQMYRPEQGGVTPGARANLRARSLVIQGAGGGEFIYNAAGVLIYSNVGADTVDPLHGQFVPRGAQFISAVSGQIVQLVDGQLFFSVASSLTKGQLSDTGQGSASWISSTFGAGDAAAIAHNNSKNVSNDGTAPELALSNRLNVFMQSVAQALGIAEQTDAFLRWQADTNGKMGWSDGTGAADVSLYRALAGALATDGLVANKSGVAETWQSMTLRGYQNGWSDFGSVPAGQYRLIPSPDNSVQLCGSLSTPANPPDGQVIINLQTVYHPVNSMNNISPRLIVPGNAAIQARLNITSAGNLQIVGASALAAGSEVVIPQTTLYRTD